MQSILHECQLAPCEALYSGCESRDEQDLELAATLMGLKWRLEERCKQIIMLTTLG